MSYLQTVPFARISPSLDRTGIESLETRIAPAGFVAVDFSAGILTLTGGDGDDRVEVQVDLQNHLVVTGLEDTLLSGDVSTLVFPLPARGILGVVAKMNAGSDSLRLRDLTVKGDVSIELGEGENSATLSDFSARNLTVLGGSEGDDFLSERLALKGNLTLDLGEGINVTGIYGTHAKILGAVTYTGAGSDGFYVETNLTVKRGMVFNLTGSDAEVGFEHYLNVQGGVQVNGASAGGVTFGLASRVTKIAGDVVVELGLGSNETSIAGLEGLEITGKLEVTGGPNSDLLSVSGSRVTVRGGMIFNGGEGENTFDASDMGKLSVGALTYTGGAGADQFNTRGDLQVKGTTQMDFGAGTNRIESFAARANFMGAVELKSASTGADSTTMIIETQFLTFGKGLFVTQTGDGPHLFFLRTSYSLKLKGGFSYEGGAGVKEVGLFADGGQIAGAIAINAGTGGADVDLFFGHMRVQAPITITGSAGNDQIRVDGNGVVFAAPVTILAGGGENAIALGRGDLPRVEFQKLVTVVSESAVADSLNSVMARFSGGLNATLGAGVSTVRIDDVVFRGKTMIDTSAGNDDLRIERAGTRASSAIAGPMEIRLGEGDDAALIGEGTVMNMIALMAKLTVDGGGGTDTINDVLATAQMSPGGAFELVGIP